MGASGTAWIKHKKQPNLRAAAMTDVPHPLSVRTGQRYFPLDRRARHPVTLRIVRVGDDVCDARREDTGSRTVQLDTTRLLAAGEDGTGTHYRFVGYTPRPGYRTHARVVALEGGWARLVCPEWHPAVPITVAAGGLPESLRHAGAWVACRGNLGAATPAATGLHALAAPAPRFDPAQLHPVALPEPAERPRDTETGDVVLFTSAGDAEAAMTGDAGVYLTGHPPATGAGRRAYLCIDGQVTGWRTVAGTRPLPNGTRILLEGPCHRVTVQAAPVLPPAAVREGRFGLQLWSRPDWPPVDERDPA